MTLHSCVDVFSHTVNYWSHNASKISQLSLCGVGEHNVNFKHKIFGNTTTTLPIDLNDLQLRDTPRKGPQR